MCACIITNLYIICLHVCKLDGHQFTITKVSCARRLSLPGVLAPIAGLTNRECSRLGGPSLKPNLIFSLTPLHHPRPVGTNGFSFQFTQCSLADGPTFRAETPQTPVEVGYWTSQLTRYLTLSVKDLQVLLLPNVLFAHGQAQDPARLMYV